jgi:hypothetical protein
MGQSFTIPEHKTNPNDLIFNTKHDLQRNNPALTKREHFAAMALQGLCAGECDLEWAASKAVILADELIKELNKGY